MAVCPIMSNAQSRIECGQEHCALWNKQYEGCSLKITGEQVSDAIDMLVRAIGEIKNKF